MTEVAPIGFGGESMRGMAYADRKHQVLIVVDVYTTIFGGNVEILVKDGGMDARFSYHVHSNTRETIEGFDAILHEQYQDQVLRFSCYENLADANDFARKLAQDALARIIKRIPKIMSNLKSHRSTKP